MKIYRSKAISLLIFLLLFLDLQAQEMLGIINSNYSGINGALINPSSLTNSRYYLDINFITVGISVENNYVYLARDEYKFSRFLGRYNDFPTHPPNRTAIYDNENTRLISGFLNERLMGPSAMLNIGKHAFGITTSLRTMVSARNIPSELAKLFYEGLDYTSQIGKQTSINKKFDIASMGWAELGLSYAYVFRQLKQEYWSGGITIKRMSGVSGAYISVRNGDYTLPDRETLIINNLNAEAGYSMPFDYGTNKLLNKPVFRGGGVGFDIGVTYQKMKKEHQSASYKSICAQQYQPYQYRIGLSIIDIGSIAFRKNVQKLIFADAATTWQGFRSINRSSVDSAVRDISQHFFNNPGLLPQENRIKISLPTALSVQLDINYTGNWYVNGTMIYPLLLSKARITRAAQFAVTPRYETDYFEVNLPISMYDLHRLRLGISMRLGLLTIGTDKLGGFFNLNDFTGLDFYFALKWSFLKGHCPEKNKKKDNSCGINEYRKFILK